MSRPVRPLPVLPSLVLLALAAPAAADWTEQLEVIGGVTVVYQQELDTNADDLSASGDLMLELVTDGGTWFAYLEGATGTDADSIFNVYPEINGDAGSVLDSDGGSHVQISELHYRMRLGEQAQLWIGQIDPSAQLDRSRIANDENTQFLGASFVNNPTIAFPDYTLGLLYRLKAEGRRPEYTVILSSSDGIADNPSRSYRELIDVTAAGKGLFAAAGARWYLGDTRIGAGAWLRTDEHPHLDDPDRESRNYGAYAVYGHAFGAQTLSLRAGIANEDVSPATRFASVALERVFDAGTLGLGYARILESSRARTLASGDTNHAEAWFRLPLGMPGLHGTLSMQYVDNPGFDRSGVVAEAHALFGGLRLDYAF